MDYQVLYDKRRRTFHCENSEDIAINLKCNDVFLVLLNVAQLISAQSVDDINAANIIS